MIVNFGSINIDMMMKVSKLPTPGDTILCPHYDALPGGKGANQAAAAARTGSRVVMFGQVGKDGFGQISIDSLKKNGVQTDYIVMNDAPTGCASISVDQRGENIITVASGANLVIESSLVPDEILEKASVVAMQMEVTPKQNWELMKRARRAGCETLLNLAPAMKITQEALKNLSYLIMNEIEARHLGKGLNIPSSNYIKLAEYLAKKYDLTAVITRGPKPVIAATADGKIWEAKTMKLKVLDTTGAGDTFAGILTACIDQNKPLKIGLKYAVVGSGLSCTRAGAQPSIPSLEEIIEVIDSIEDPKCMNS